MTAVGHRRHRVWRRQGNPPAPTHRLEVSRRVDTLVGSMLVAGFVVFLTGAAAWRLAYEQALPDALRLIHADRRRRAWIHLWMIPAMFVTTAGTAGLTILFADPTATVLAAMGTAVYALGAVCWIVSLTFRVTVVPWAAERTVADDRVPEGFLPLDAWAGSLYVVHMSASYTAFAVLGTAVLVGEVLPSWLGWVGVVLGVGSLLGFAASRASGPFNPPILAHLYTGLVGVAVLAQ